MSSVNKAIILGRLGKDPETRYMADGKAVTNFTLATSETWKDKSGEKQEKTEWHNCTVYGKLAEVVGEYMRKGSQAYVEGKIQTRKWQDKEGKDRYTTEIIVNELTMLGGKSDSSEPKPEKQSKPAQQANTEKPKNFDNFEDDIPFMWHGSRGAGVDWRNM